MENSNISVPEKRIAEFERLGYGMFIHWGLYALSGAGEKTMLFHKIPKEEYRKRVERFTAEKFDAKEIVQMAKHAGMKYITLTTRHHDGFSLYDTCGLSDYDAPHSACGRDLIREFVDACNAENICPFFYHTTLDWYQDSYANDFEAYLEYLYRSIEVLCSNYGPVGGFWFDGNWDKPDADWQEEKLYSMIRRLQPDAMIINNSGVFDRGSSRNEMLDSVTFENGKPGKINRSGMKKYQAAEMCQTMNTVWGFGEQNYDYKAPSELIETLCLCRRYGANYLLNVSPKGNGEIPLLQQAMLDNTGNWIRTVAPEVIYEGNPTDVAGPGNDFALLYDNKLYIFVHKLNTGGDNHIIIPGAYCGTRTYANIPGKPKAAYWTDNSETLSWKCCGDALQLDCTSYSYGQNLVVRVACIELN